MSTSTENKAKHAPGPWEAVAHDRPERWDISEVCMVYGTSSPLVIGARRMEGDPACRFGASAEANASLIIAAPDLLAVAKMIERIPMSVPRHIVQAARAAILKAEWSI